MSTLTAFATKQEHDGNNITPECAWLTVNRSCNFRCKGCYAQGTDYKSDQDMTLELAEQLLVLISSIGIKNVTVIGGEPTLWSHILKFNRLCNSKGIRTTIVTNASRFGDDAFWHDYQNASNTKAGISLKAFDGKSHRTLAGVSNFTLIEKGLRRGISHFKCGVSTYYSKANKDSILDIAGFAMRCGAKCLSISPCTPAINNGFPDGTYVVHPHETVRHIIEIYPLLMKITGGRLTFSMKLPLCIWPPEFVEMLIKRNQISTVCQLQHRTGMIFDTNGRLALCNSLFDYCIGKYGTDFSDRQSLLTTMNSQVTRAIYDKITSYPSSACIKCRMYDICAGGCPLFWTLYQPQDIIPGSVSF